MGFIYRYIDTNDEMVKYVGIVWSTNSINGLKKRIRDHLKDYWNKMGNWRVEYTKKDICSRTDAEYFEAHYISVYDTGKYFNKNKVGWGRSSFLPDLDNWSILDLSFLKDKRNKKQYINDVNEILESMVDKVMLEHKDRVGFINNLQIKRKGKPVKSANALNALFANEYKVNYRIRVFATTRQYKNENGESCKKKYKNAWKVERI